MQLWEQLLQVLAELLAVYQALTACSREKKELLVSRPAPDKLQAIVGREQELLLAAAAAEQRRHALSRELARALGLGEEAPTLSRLAPLAPAGPLRQRLEAWQAACGAALKELQALNTTNSRLLQQALHFVQYQVNVLSQATAADTYAPPGRGQQTGLKLFDTKA